MKAEVIEETVAALYLSTTQHLPEECLGGLRWPEDRKNRRQKKNG